MADRYFGLPPDGVGKRVHAEPVEEVKYKNATGTFRLGDTVTGATSGSQGTVREVGAQFIWVSLAAGTGFTDGEDLQVGGATVAQADGNSYPVFTQAVHVAGRTNPRHVQEVDQFGQAYVRFGEGALQLDAFGRLQASHAVTLGAYLQEYGINDKELYVNTVGGGSVTHLTSTSGMLLQTGTAAGDKAKVVSHLYHPYQLGKSQLFMATVAVGDTGKSGVARVWGYGDDSDGVFFRLNGTTLEVLMRSSTSVGGSAGEVAVPQSQWNVDRLDGSRGTNNPSGVTLDVSRDNIYWIDLQWLGAGRVRFGVIIEGRRIICHEMFHANLHVEPYIRTAALPVYAEQENVAAAGSTSEMRVWCMAVMSEGDLAPISRHLFKHVRPGENVDGGIYKKMVFNWHPGRALLSVRPKLTINGKTNRVVALPRVLSYVNEDSYPHAITARRGAQVNNPTWQDFHAASSLEFDDKGDVDYTNRGVQVGHWIVAPGEAVAIDLSAVFDLRREKVILDAFGADQDRFLVCFTTYNLSPIRSATETMSFSGDVITRAAGDWTADGFVAGDGIYVHQSLSNDGYYVVTNVTATDLTVQNIDGSAVSFTSESNTAGVTVQGGPTGKAFGSLNVVEYW